MSAFVLVCPVCGSARSCRSEHLGDCPDCGEHHLVTVDRDRLHDYHRQIDEPVFDEP